MIIQLKYPTKWDTDQHNGELTFQTSKN